MFGSHARTFLTIFVMTLVAVWMTAEACDPRKIVRGCKIQKGRCFCGVGCPNEFRYANREDCRAALKGEGNDACDDNPCENGGVCIQTGTTYRCRCEGTGYYGARCRSACPSPSETPLKSYPYECIEI